MEPLTIVVSYVAVKMVDQFVSQEGYGWLREVFFPKQKYVDKLSQLIIESISEYETQYPIIDDCVPFYHSKPLFDALNDYVLYQKRPSRERLLERFNKFPNITPPSHDELETFYQIFLPKINCCKELRKLHIDETYKEKIFDISDAIADLKLLVQSLDEKLSFTLNKEWLNQKCQEAIADLGGRYTPELNLKLKVARIFDGMGRSSNFYTEVYSKFDDFLVKGSDISHCEDISTQLFLIAKNINEITQLFQDTEFCNISIIPISAFLNSISECQNAINESESVLWGIKEKSLKDHGKEKTFNDKYSRTLRDLGEFSHACNKLTHYLDSTTVRLTNNPYLLLEGEAGIGKSHLLADIVNTRIESEYPSIFILGQQLTSDESPWGQIFKRLQLNISSKEFLEKLNFYGQHIGKRVLIFIDAINEGNGNNFWEDNINSFIDEIRNYEWLGVVMSIRTTYKNITIKAEQIHRNRFEVYKHIGFENVELDAINMFYDNYHIERPTSPYLNPEFKNPLFLKLFCEGIRKNGLSRVPKGFHGISQILGFLVDGVNKTLSSHKKYNYDSSLPLVADALKKLISVKLSLGKNHILLKDAVIAVNTVVKDFVTDKNFLRDLINEGLLTKNIIRKGDGRVDEIVYLSYERFDDHLTVEYLLDNIADIEAAFQAGGSIKKYIKDEYSLYSNQGMIEALSIQLPEKFGKELYELLPEFNNNSRLVVAFIDSLIWRKADSIDFNKLKDFINEVVIRDEYTFSHFLEMLISVSALEDHPFNANFLHHWLLVHPLPDRDKQWSTELMYKYSEESPFQYLIDWAWSETDKSYISDDSIELVATVICWFLTSNDREMRDCSTKALINLLENRISVLVCIIDKFDTVNDPYVYERIFAVALGCTLRTKQTHELKKLAETVYNKIFDVEFVYPHILLRDYAREIIEYTSYLGVVLDDVDLNKTKPPYNSMWPENISTKEELKELYDNSEYWSIWRSVMGDGDFSLYIIGTRGRSDWSGCKFGQEPVDRKKIYEDFKADLSDTQIDLLNSLDPLIYDEDENSDKEFIIAGTLISMGAMKYPVDRKTEKELSTNRSNFIDSLSEEQSVLYKNEIEPYLDHNNNLLDTEKYFDLRLAERFIFNRVIELGWDPSKHGNFDKNIGRGLGRGRRDSNQERIGKKYQWIAYYEFMARLADNFIRFDGYGKHRKEYSYLGPWDPYIRDIDPTILLKETGRTELEHKNEKDWWASTEVFDWNCSFKEWMSNTSTVINSHGLIEVKDNNDEEWLILESYLTWKEPKIIGKDAWGHPRKEVWCQTKSYLVQSSEYVQFKNWAANQHFMGRWMPESSNLYQLFSREYYWSEAFESFKTDYYSLSDWVDVVDQDTDDHIADVSVTAINYLWEEEFDKSKADVLRFIKPSHIIFDKMRLKYGSEEGSYVDKDGNIICFAAEALHDTEACLLVKKEPFLQMLRENDLNILWTLLGEKGVIGGEVYYGRVEFSGTFYIENDCIKGEHTIFTDS